MPNLRRTTKKPQRFRESPLSSREGTPEPVDPKPDDNMSIILNTLQSMQTKIDRLERAAPVEGKDDSDQGEDARESDVPESTDTFGEQTPLTYRGRRKHRSRNRRPLSDDSRSPPRKRKIRRRSPTPDASAGETTEEDVSGSDSDTSNSDTDYEEYDKPMITFGTIVGQSVKDKLRQKILNNKYLEMAELLPNFKSNNKQDDSVTLKQDKNNAPRWVKSRPRCDINFGQWCEAFATFTSIHMERAKTRRAMLKLTRSLLTYQRKITALKKKNYDWAAYDRHFRSERETTKDSWATTRQDLLTMYQPSTQEHFRSQRANSGPQQRNQHQSKKRNQTRDGIHIPAGYCIAFHTKGQRCTTKDCQYEHRCPTCRARHPIFMQCNTAQSRQQNDHPKSAPPYQKAQPSHDNSK